MNDGRHCLRSHWTATTLVYSLRCALSSRELVARQTRSTRRPQPFHAGLEDTCRQDPRCMTTHRCVGDVGIGVSCRDELDVMNERARQACRRRSGPSSDCVGQMSTSFMVTLSSSSMPPRTATFHVAPSARRPSPRDIADGAHELVDVGIVGVGAQMLGVGSNHDALLLAATVLIEQAGGRRNSRQVERPGPPFVRASLACRAPCRC